MMMTTTSKPASDKSLKYLHDLILIHDQMGMVESMPEPWRVLWSRVMNGFVYCDRKGYGPEALNDFFENDESPKLEQSDCSKFIDQLKKQPRLEESEAKHLAKMAGKNPVTEAGMYRDDDGTIYKVQAAVHGSGNLYAKELVMEEPECGGCNNDDPCDPPCKWTARFEYAPGVLKSLRADQKLTYEQAKEFGALYGTCVVCGRTLTNELSIALGIGPVCGRRQFGGEFEFMIDAAKVKLAESPVDLGDPKYGR